MNSLINLRHFHVHFRSICQFSLTMMIFGLLISCTIQPAPDVGFTDLKGNQFTLAQFKGRVVLINFWATSCSTCVAEMPDMMKLYEKYHAQGLEYIAAAMAYDPPNYVINFTETRKLPFIVTLDIDGKLARAFGDIKLTPTTFVINKHGDIIKKYVGAPEFMQLSQLLETQLHDTAK